MEITLGQGYEPRRGNTPAESIFERSLPNALTCKSNELFALARKSSLWTLSFGLACCAIEMMSTHMSHHDLDRFGVITWPSPRQADVMIVAGTVVKKMADPIKLLYEQMPDPKWVIAMGSCATKRRTLLPVLLRSHGGRPHHSGRRLRTWMSSSP